MSVSEAKRAANTANGRKGGPKTPEGKARSRMNGLKHGLRAEVAVLPGENTDAFNHRLQSWSRELQPRSEVEQYLVETAVSASWRRDRCLRAETAILTERVLDAEDPDEEIAIAEAERIGAGLLDHPQRVSRQLRTTPAGCRWMLERWDDLIESLELIGLWDHAEKDKALSLIGFRANQAFDETVAGHVIIAFVSASWGREATSDMIRSAVGGIPRKGMNPSTFERNVEATRKVLLDRDEGRASLEAFAEECRDELADRLARLEAIEARRRATAADRAAFDAGAEGQARLRYESMHERAFRSALRELRAEQSARLDRDSDPGPPDDEPEAPTEPTEASIAFAEAEPEAPTEPTEEAPTALEEAESEAPTEPTEESSGGRGRAERCPGIEAGAPGHRSALPRPPQEAAPSEPTEAPSEPTGASKSSAPTGPNGATKAAAPTGVDDRPGPPEPGRPHRGVELFRQGDGGLPRSVGSRP